MVTMLNPSEECEKIKYLFFDRNERIVVYPTLFINSMLANNRYSLQTVYQYAKVLKYFCTYIETTLISISIDDSLRAIEGNVIDNYIKKLSNSAIKESTIRNRDAIIKQFMEWLTTEESGWAREKSGYVGDKLKSANPVSNLPKYVTTEEVVKFLLNLHDENQRCLGHFLYDTGVRISEVPRILLSDLPDLGKYPIEQNYFKLEIKGSKGSGGQIKPRYTYISRSMVERIQRLHKNNKKYIKATMRFRNEMPLFLNVFGNPITKEAIANLLFRGKKRADMKIHAHRFRHGFAMSILASEMDNSLINKLVILKEALGHEDISTTQIYIKVAPQVIQNTREQNQVKQINYRFEEAQYIYLNTFKPQKKHTEKRGRS